MKPVTRGINTKVKSNWVPDSLIKAFSSSRKTTTLWIRAGPGQRAAKSYYFRRLQPPLDISLLVVVVEVSWLATCFQPLAERDVDSQLWWKLALVVVVAREAVLSLVDGWTSSGEEQRWQIEPQQKKTRFSAYLASCSQKESRNSRLDMIARSLASS